MTGCGTPTRLAADVIEQFAVSPTASLETVAMLLGVGEDVATAARTTFRRYGLLTAESPDQFAHPRCARPSSTGCPRAI